MRVRAVLASVALIVAASQGAVQSARAQGYGAPPPPPAYGPPPPPPAYGLPSGSGRSTYGGGGGQLCANENGFCAFRGYATVRYGARGRYVERQVRDGIPCNNRVFGDPIYGVPKRCYID